LQTRNLIKKENRTHYSLSMISISNMLHYNVEGNSQL